VNKLSFLLLFFSLSLAAFYTPDSPLYSYNDIEIKASAYPDKTISQDVNAIFLEVKNSSGFNLRLEPNFNSLIVDGTGRRYYRERVDSRAEFVPGIIEPRSERKGFIYFKKLKQPIGKFKLILKNIKLYNGKSSSQQAEWQFAAVSENSETRLAEIEAAAAVQEAAPGLLPAAELQNLEYDKQLQVAKAERENYDKLKFKIEMPSLARRGDTLDIKLYAPTIADVESVTMLIGVSQTLELRKMAGGVFSSTMRIPELMDYGKYVVSFYIRFVDGNKIIRQRTLDIKTY